MSAGAGSETFVGYAGFLILAALVGFPDMGWGGVMAVLGMIYFGLALTNGAGTAAKRRQRKHR